MPGIRAAICHDTYSAHQGVEHDDMNVLTLGARVIGIEPAVECSLAFLAATFSRRAAPPAPAGQGARDRGRRARAATDLPPRRAATIRGWRSSTSRSTSSATYRPPRDEPADFDAFWAATLAASRARRAAPVVADVDDRPRDHRGGRRDLLGFDGQPIKAWLLRPAGRTGPLPTIVEYIGYGGGRGQPYEWLLWASAGYAHLVMDTRGQGGTWQAGDTSDIDDDAVRARRPRAS